MDNAYHIKYAWHTHETLHGVFPKPVTDIAEPDADGPGMMYLATLGTVTFSLEAFRGAIRWSCSTVMYCTLE